MAYKVVFKTLKNKLSCSGCAPASVILCVREELIAPKVCYPDPLEAPLTTVGTSIVLHTITGTVLGVSRIKDTCGGYTYKYQISYDDLQLVPDTTLTAADVLNIFCDGCLTQYMRDLAGEGVRVELVPEEGEEPAKIRLVNQYGCIYEWEQGGSSSTFVETPITPEDTTTIDTDVFGTNQHTIRSAVKLDPTVGNILYIAAGGLRVDCSAILNACGTTGGEIENTVTDTATINFATSGTLQRNITGSVNVSAASGNQLSVNGDGLFVPPTTETPNTALDTNSIDVSATGTLGRAISAALRVSANAGNAIVVDGTGVFVPAETPNTYTDSTTIDFSGSGTANRTLTGSVKLSSTAGNAITANGTGIYSVLKGADEVNTSVNAAVPINISSGGPISYAQTGAITLSNPSAVQAMKYVAVFTFFSQTVMSGPGPTAVWTHSGQLNINSGGWTTVTNLVYGSFPVGPVGLPWFHTYTASGTIAAGGSIVLEARQLVSIAGTGTGSSITAASTGIRAFGVNQ